MKMKPYGVSALALLGALLLGTGQVQASETLNTILGGGAGGVAGTMIGKELGGDTGALVGALGGAGVARAWNVVRGRSEDVVRWGDAFLERLAVTSLLRYLAVAHYGRGRGDYRDGEYPPFWRPRVESAVAARRGAFVEAWAGREPGCDAAAVAAALAPLLRATARAVLAELYPAALAAGA